MTISCILLLLPLAQPAEAATVNELTDSSGITWHMSAVDGDEPSWKAGYGDIGRFVENDGSVYVTKIVIPASVTRLMLPSTIEWLSHGSAFSCHPAVKYFTVGATDDHPNIEAVSVNRSAMLKMPCFRNCPKLAKFDFENTTDWNPGKIGWYSLYTVKDGVLYDGDMIDLKKYPEGRAGDTFTVPSSVVKVHQYTFANTKLKKIIFEGDAPEITRAYSDDSWTTVSNTVVKGSQNLGLVCYRQKSKGWGKYWCGIQTEMILDAISGLTATAGTQADGVQLSWNENVNASRYYIYRTEGRSRVWIGATSETSYLDETAIPQTKYHYDVVGVRGGSGPCDDPDLIVEGFVCQSVEGWAAEPIFEFSVEEGEATLLSCVCAGGQLVIPSEFNGFPVVSISQEACSYRFGVTSIVVPDGIRTIGDDAFYGCYGNLASIFISASVEDIGSGAFAECDCLMEINVDPSNPCYTSQNGILYNKDMTDVVVVPGGVEGLIAIPSGVRRICDGSFDSCRFFTALSIPASVIEVDPRAFHWCDEFVEWIVDPANEVYSSVDGVLFSKDKVEIVSFPEGIVGPYEIPSGVRRIGAYAFANYRSWLKSVTIPEGVADIGDHAFYQSCLSEISIPNGVTNIGAYAFYYSQYLSSVVLPESLLRIGDCAFEGCGRIAKVRIPESVETVGGFAFEYCRGLTSLEIPVHMHVGLRAFANCPSLKEVLVKNYGDIEPTKQMLESSGVDVSKVTFECVVEPIRIVFNASYGAETMLPLIMDAISVCQLPSCTFTPPAGKRFAGWACSNGRRYDDGMLVFDLAKPGETVTMTAIWE